MSQIREYRRNSLKSGGFGFDDQTVIFLKKLVDAFGESPYNKTNS
jgi:hypothetical protein